MTDNRLRVSDADLYYGLRGQGPLVLLVGAPMDATAFGPLAELLAADHTVLTTDPRGINRSTLDDPDQDSTLPQRADDLARLIDHLDAGPAVAFGSSGGAVGVLALAELYPDRVGAVIAHEPPLDELVDDRDKLRVQTEEMIAAYLSGDIRGAWARFIETANIQLPPPVFEAMFGTPRAGQMAADERFQFEHMLRATTRWRPDTEALRCGPVRIVVGIGEQSAGQLCDRTSRALAARLGTPPAMFPGGHIGFVDDPSAFAARLRAHL